jgi:hypothetical protein
VFSIAASSGPLSRTVTGLHTGLAESPGCLVFQSPARSAEPAALRQLQRRPFAGFAGGSFVWSFSWIDPRGIVCQPNRLRLEN